MNLQTASQTDQNQIEVCCPLCGQKSTRIKALRTGVLIFVCIMAYWKTWTVTGCPECIRKKLAENTILNLLTANIMWPIAVFPWMLIQFLRTALEGHSPVILEQLGLPVPPPIPLWKQFQEQLPITFRLIGTVQLFIALSLFAGVGFVLSNTWHRNHRLNLDLILLQAFVCVTGVAIGYLAFSGISKVLGWAPSIGQRIAVAILIAIMLPFASPWVARMMRVAAVERLIIRTPVNDSNLSDRCVHTEYALI